MNGAARRTVYSPLARRSRSAASFQTQRGGHGLVIAGRLAHQGPGHRRVQPFLAIVQAGRGLLGQPGVPLGLPGHAPPGWDAARGQMQQWQFVTAGVDRGGREPLLGGEQHVVPRPGQVLGQGQVEVGAQAQGEGGSLARQLQAGGQVPDGRAQGRHIGAA
jgi:hypothetical protein